MAIYRSFRTNECRIDDGIVERLIDDAVFVEDDQPGIRHYRLTMDDGTTIMVERRYPRAVNQWLYYELERRQIVA